MAKMKKPNQNYKSQVCEMTLKECDELEHARMGILEDKFEIERRTNKLSNSLSSIIKLIEGKPRIDNISGDEGILATYYTNHLERLKNMADFLKSEQYFSDLELKDRDGKRYSKLGFYNNITHHIKEKCSCKNW